jgi:hypothetical protein
MAAGRARWLAPRWTAGEDDQHDWPGSDHVSVTAAGTMARSAEKEAE